MASPMIDEGSNAGRGLRALTRIVVSRLGINDDDAFIAECCPRCGRPPKKADRIELPGGGRRVIVKTAQARMLALSGTRLLIARCDCGTQRESDARRDSDAYYCVITYGPLEYRGCGYLAYTIVEFGSQAGLLAGSFADVRSPAADGGCPDDVVGREALEFINRAVALANGREFRETCDNWQETDYSSGWVSL